MTISPSALPTSPRKPRVHCLHNLNAGARPLAEKLFDLYEPSRPGWDEWREKADGIMVRSAEITAEDAATFGPQLKFISKHGVGCNKLAVVALRKHGITTMNTPGVNATAVGELALGLMLALARDISTIDRAIRSGAVVNRTTMGGLGFTLRGKVLGVVGGGNIGQKVGKMFASAFEGPVLVYDPYLSSTVWEEKWEAPFRVFASDRPERLRRVDSLDELLRAADIVTLHVPLKENTTDLLAAKELKLMKASALLINTARGGVVNEEALADALDQGWITGAAIDAYSEEPPTLERFSRLVSHPRVISTPHIGAACADVVTATAIAVIEHLDEALRGEIPRDVVLD